MAYTQEQINTALQQELTARPGTSYDDMLAFATNTWGLSPTQVQNAFIALPDGTSDKEQINAWQDMYKDSKDSLIHSMFDTSQINENISNRADLNPTEKQQLSNLYIYFNDGGPTSNDAALMRDYATRTGLSNADIARLTGVPIAEVNAYFSQARPTAAINVTQLTAPPPITPVTVTRPVTPTPVTRQVTGPTLQPASDSNALYKGIFDFSDAMSSIGSGQGSRTVGASEYRPLNAGNASYKSELIKSLRNSTGGNFSNNPGVNLSQPSINSGDLQLAPRSGGANNPSVLTPGGGTPKPPPAPPSSPGRGTAGTPADMAAGYAGYWSSKPTGSVIDWAGGTLRRLDASSALYTDPNGAGVILTPDSDLNYLANMFPGIAKQWYTEFGFVPTPLYQEQGGAGP